MSLKQEVFLTVHDEKGALVLDATGLRVDFDVRYVDGFSRATFKVYNLNDETVKNIMTGERYVTVYTRLHGRNDFLVANKYFVSNAYNETILPNTVVTLFCYDKLQKDVFENQLPDYGVTVYAPITLERMITAVFTAAGYSAAPTFLYFPNNLHKLVSPAASATFDGSVEEALLEMAEEYKYKTYTLDGKVTLMYCPDAGTVDKTNLAEQDAIQLSTDMMRSNPVIGPAVLNITSNLDSRLKPGKVVDISQLLTIGTSESGINSEVADGFFKTGLSGFNHYFILAVQHKGSNYTGDWFTNITASAPTKGTVASPIHWLNP